MEIADRLTELRDALLLPRAAPDPESGHVRLPITPAMIEGGVDLHFRAPAWSGVDDARLVYVCAFEAGWLAAGQRVTTALGLPEARGQEADAALLALDPKLSFSEIAIRLRASARSVSETEQDGNVVTFPRPRVR